jgi:hypothetical protein
LSGGWGVSTDQAPAAVPAPLLVLPSDILSEGT